MPFGFADFLLITTDKLAAYETAIANHFQKVHYAYLQIVKQRRKKRLVTVKERPRFNRPVSQISTQIPSFYSSYENGTHFYSIRMARFNCRPDRS